MAVPCCLHTVLIYLYQEHEIPCYTSRNHGWKSQMKQIPRYKNLDDITSIGSQFVNTWLQIVIHQYSWATPYCCRPCEAQTPALACYPFPGTANAAECSGTTSDPSSSTTTSACLHQMAAACQLAMANACNQGSMWQVRVARGRRVIRGNSAVVACRADSLARSVLYTAWWRQILHPRLLRTTQSVGLTKPSYRGFLMEGRRKSGNRLHLVVMGLRSTGLFIAGIVVCPRVMLCRGTPFQILE